MKPWLIDKTRSDAFVPAITRALGEVLIGPAPMLEDRDRATDLLVFTLAPVRVACRVRDAAQLSDAYAYQVTIRSRRPSGIETEKQKIRDGWGDFFFYGWGDFKTGALRRWVLLDLAALRADWIDRGWRAAFVKRKTNVDGSSDFDVFDTRRLPVRCVRAAHNWTWTAAASAVG